MLAVISLLIVLTLSILITRIATEALTYTGLSRQSARFQARSAFSGVGFTTSEAEQVVNHPVRRKILMWLMLLGNVGIVTVVSSMVLTFVGASAADTSLRLAMLGGGITALWLAGNSKLVDRWLSRRIARLLKRMTDLDVRDYANVLHLSGEYQIVEMLVRPQDWLANKTLSKLRLRHEGVLVLGIRTADGGYVGAPDGATMISPGDELLLYGRVSAMQKLDERREGIGGNLAHLDAVAEQKQVSEVEHAEAHKPHKDSAEPPETSGAASIVRPGRQY